MTVPLLYPPYVATRRRAPLAPLVPLPATLSELTGPVWRTGDLAPGAEDLTHHHVGEPVGQRIAVSGRVFDRDGRPAPGTMVEIWQANSAGRYRHAADVWGAPLDPNFTGCGRTLPDPAIADDPVHAALPPDRRGTLVARARSGGALEWNVILQGDGETLFFEDGSC